MSSNLDIPKVVHTKIYKREKSKYQYVSIVRQSGRLIWKARTPNGPTKTWFETEDAAARWVDLELIKQGLEPINILKSLKKQSA